MFYWCWQEIDYTEIHDNWCFHWLDQPLPWLLLHFLPPFHLHHLIYMAMVIEVTTPMTINLLFLIHNLNLNLLLLIHPWLHTTIAHQPSRATYSSLFKAISSSWFSASRSIPRFIFDLTHSHGFSTCSSARIHSRYQRVLVSSAWCGRRGWKIAEAWITYLYNNHGSTKSYGPKHQDKEVGQRSLLYHKAKVEDQIQRFILALKGTTEIWVSNATSSNGKNLLDCSCPAWEV